MVNEPIDRPKPTRPFQRLRIVVMGYVIRGPLGGLAWHHLQYVAGFERLGHDVLFIEDSDDYPSCVHLDRDAVDTDPTEGLQFAANAFDRLGISGKFAYYDGHTRQWRGPAANKAEAFCKSADIVLNISGINPVRPWWAEVPLRALIDTDPAFVQIRHLQSERARTLAEAHNRFFTFAEKFGDEDCLVPRDGFPWMPTRQPVVLDAWPVRPITPDAPFSTVMQWGSYQALEHEGTSYGMKSVSFEPYFDLPQRTTVPLLLGIGGAARPPKARLLEHGWQVRNSIDFTRDPWQYQQFIQDSAGEFSIAKQGYVASRSGWFSERSANYLASGRPVIVQDTGFSDLLPTGEGLHTFQTPQEAVGALERVRADLPAQGAAARQLAEQSFDAKKVLADLLARASSSTGAWV